jgi:hypothetical protein
MPFLTGRQSKLAKLLEDLIFKQTLVEIEFFNGNVIYGTVVSYELSPEHLILTVKGSPNTYIVNFRHVVDIRVKQS